MKRLKKLVSRILNKVIASSITYQLTRIFDSYFASSSRQIENVLMLQGRALALQNADRAPFDNIQKAEFKVFSQFGEDGILQYLIREELIKSEELCGFESKLKFFHITNLDIFKKLKDL